MKECPVCHMDMRETPKYGVLIDICPSCKGVWLDRGELQKIITLAHEFEDEHEDLYHNYQKDFDHYRKQQDYHHSGHHHSHHKYHHKKKKHPLLKLMNEIFD